MLLQYITWNVSPEIASIGPLTFRWYGLLFAAGFLVGLYMVRRTVSKKSMLWILDKVVVPTALAACFIRLGNLMNSEILGKPADVPWAFIFVRRDQLPRHPVQLYESFTYLLSFFTLYWMYWKRNK